MTSLVNNIVLAAAFIAFAAFLDYLICKICDIIESRLDTDECKDENLLHTMSIYPYLVCLMTDTEEDSEDENSREADKVDTDRLEGQEDESPGSGRPAGISGQSASPPECS